jgi:hypothetical protein
MPGITFAAVKGTGGQAIPATLMMSENGSSFLIVEGTCRYWVQTGQLEHVVSGMLTAADRQALREDFQLDRWQQLVGDYPNSGFDIPSYFYVFGRGKLQTPCGTSDEVGGCIQTGTGSKSDQNLGPLHAAFYNTTRRFSARGPTVTADLRYLLVEGTSAVVNYQWSNPGTWPLGDPREVATPQSVLDNGYTRGSSRLASGRDADALRELWRQYLDYEISGREVDMPASASAAIPIEVDGTRYQLFIRDSIPLEAPNGLIAY